MDHTLYEPKKALETNQAYACVAQPDDRLIFPHVDSCLGLILRLEDATMFAGHIPQQWPGMSEPDRKLCYYKMLQLLEANRNRLGGKPIAMVISIGPNDWGTLNQESTGKLKPPAMLTIWTKATSGVDVVVTRDVVEITSCKNKNVTKFPIDDTGYEDHTFAD